MNINITSLATLQVEINRLTAEKKMHEQQLNVFLKSYAHSLRPANLIKQAFSSFKNDSELKSKMFTKGSEAAIGFVLSQLVFKNSNFLIKTLGTIMGTSFATGIFGEDSATYLQKFKNLIQKFKAKKEPPANHVFDEDDIYTG